MQLQCDTKWQPAGRREVVTDLLCVLSLSHTGRCSETQTGTMPAEPTVSRREVVTNLLCVLV